MIDPPILAQRPRLADSALIIALEMTAEILAEKLERLPAAPGVYLFKNLESRIIYIGKAKSLRHRVRSYFQSGHTLDHKTEVLKQSISDLDYVLTDNEVEALILESALVKKTKPLFNVHLKDDKSFLHIKLTVNEDYPRVLLTRRTPPDGARYFGPYLPASLARNTVKIINRHFLLRTCDLEIDGNLDRPCLEYQIKRCLGPCVRGLCTHDQYQRAVKDVILLLEGKNETLIGRLTQKMAEASAWERFEAAAFYRDRISLVRDLAKRQKMMMSGLQDVDIFAYHRRGAQVALQLFTMRNGRVVGKREFFWDKLTHFVPADFLRDALQQYYLNAGFVPGQIYLPTEIEDQQIISQWLTGKAVGRRKVRLLTPRRGEKHNLLLLVERNAKIAFETRFRVIQSRRRILEAVQQTLDLPSRPQHIEAFDISNIQGSETVASAVVCRGGKMQRSEYRRFKIRGLEGADDYAAIYQVVRRRWRRLLAERKPLPDLLLVDGGKGQLHFAYQALSELGVEDTPLISLAKREEIIFVQGQDEPLRLERSSPVLRLFQEIRDEAHRFAVTYHRKRRAIRDFNSELDEVAGIGEKRKKRLLRSFGSVARIREASLEELAPYLGKKLARSLKAKLNGLEADDS